MLSVSLLLEVSTILYSRQFGAFSAFDTTKQVLEKVDYSTMFFVVF